MTLRRLGRDLAGIPMSTAWYLSDLAEAKGRQQLFTRQSPQRLKALREHAMIESAVASNRIEGVEIDPSRETRVGETAARRGEKSETVIAAVERATAPFTIAELQRECPGVSVDMLRHVLNALKAERRVECLGRGRSARWRRIRIR